MPTRLPVHARSARRLALLLSALAAALTLTGCQGIERTASRAWDNLFPPPPGQVARDAFNPYDADLRRRSISTLSAASFGGQPPYVRIYRLLLGDPRLLGPNARPDPDPTVRAACVKALGDHGNVDDVPLILLRFNDDAAFVRWECANALQKIHDPTDAAAVPLVAGLQHDQDADIRQSCAVALGQYDTTAVFNALVGALDDQSYSVVQAAHRSLVTLTGYNFGNDSALWLIWSRQGPDELFQHRKEYVWQPYVAPRTFWDKAKFWEKPPPTPAPRPPTGLTATTSPKANQ